MESRRKDNGKNEKHRDGGRAKTKAEKQVEKYEEQLKTAKGSEAKKIKDKMRHVIEDATRK